jgi:hypothetical protein
MGLLLMLGVRSSCEGRHMARKRKVRIAAFPCTIHRFTDAHDAVVHCVTERQARALVAAIGDRMKRVGPRLNRDETKVVVLCKGGRFGYGLSAAV